jgi:luciferase-like monooxygenase
MWQLAAETLSHFPEVVVTASGIEGYPVSVRQRSPRYDADTGETPVLIPTSVAAVAGPANVLAHYHDENLGNLRIARIKGRLERREGSWIFISTGFTAAVAGSRRRRGAFGARGHLCPQHRLVPACSVGPRPGGGGLGDWRSPQDRVGRRLRCRGIRRGGSGLPTPAERVQLVGEHVKQIRATFADRTIPLPAQRVPPIMIGGAGDKMLAMAAEHADLVSILTFSTETELAQRVQYTKERAGERLDQIELSFSFGQVSIDDPNDLQILQQVVPKASESQLRSMATLLDGPVEAAAERIARMHQELRISYFTFSITVCGGVTWPTLEKLVARAKG